MATRKLDRVREFTFYRIDGQIDTHVMCGHHAAVEESSDETTMVSVAQTIGEEACGRCADDGAVGR